jgi:hypothetical protein
MSMQKKQTRLHRDNARRDTAIDKRDRIARSQTGRLIRESRRVTQGQIRHLYALTHQLEPHRGAWARRIREMIRDNLVQTVPRYLKLREALERVLAKLEGETVDPSE